MESAVDGHASEAEPSSGSDLLAADAALGEDADTVRWTRAFIAERNGALADVMLDDVLAAARDATVDEEGVRRALHTMGVRARRNGRLRLRSATEDVASPEAGADPATREQAGRRKQRARDDDAAALLGSESRSNRAPGGKVRIVAVDLDTDDQVDMGQPMSIVVQIRCDEPGRLHGRVLVRDGQRGELEAIAHVRDVTHPGLYSFSCDIPADGLGGLKHAVDVEAWLVTASGTYASMHASAQRFRARERSGRGPFVHIDARWSEGRV